DLVTGVQTCALPICSLEIIRTLAGRTGRDGDKMSGLRTKVGLIGAPILLDSLSYVECRVTGNLDNEENTIFVGDVIGAERLNPRSEERRVGKECRCQ